MTIIFDENTSKHIARILAVMQNRLNRRDRTIHSVHAASDYFRKAETDPEIFGDFPDDGVLISFDTQPPKAWQHLVTEEQQRASIIYFQLPDPLGYWQLFRLFTNAWKDILELGQQKECFLHTIGPDEVRSYISG